MIKTYKDLRYLKTFEERFEYLRLDSIVGKPTFGFERYLNQAFYKSRDWKRTRRDVIIRDNGCDLGDPDRELTDIIVVHHIMPITIEDIEMCNDCVFDMNNLICCSDNTHKAIHYGDSDLLVKILPERTRGDTTLWSRVY